MTCPALETIAGWALSELSEAEAESFEEHYFGCSDCFGRAQSLLKLEAALRRAPPPVLTAERRRGLESSDQQLNAVHVQPGNKALIRLSESKPLGVWYLHCDLQGISRVDLEGRTPAGDTWFQFSDVPFDSEHGLVAMPCHFHYRALGLASMFHARLSSPEPAGPRLLAEYVLDHEFENL